MTSNQIAYHKFKEDQRSNRAREVEQNRSNLAKEFETNRANLASERNAEMANRIKAFEVPSKYMSSFGNIIKAAGGLI